MSETEADRRCGTCGWFTPDTDYDYEGYGFCGWDGILVNLPMWVFDHENEYGRGMHETDGTNCQTWESKP